MSDTPEIVRRYFALAGQADKGPHLALFADDAVVEDATARSRAVATVPA
ncbi:hypothetical protein O7622_20430 [Micromonospora sp. WMMD1076]|nr:hypothetical protein [Micromonospora sp. WMMD1076]WFF05416.1 hypothetical protein O7622_20430 [Micromonospora sp. WMMD1076]